MDESVKVIPCPTFNEMILSNLGDYDTTVEVSSVPLEFHKIILIMHSTVFKTIFDGKFKKYDILKIENDPDIFAKLKELMYNKQPELTIEEHVEIINIADFYDMGEIYKATTEQLYKKVTKEDVYDAYRHLKPDESKKKVALIIARFFAHYKSCAETQTLLKSITDGDDMIKFVKYLVDLNAITDENSSESYIGVTSPDFIAEIELLNLINDWYTFFKTTKKDIQDSEKYFNELLKFIRVANFTVRQLLHEIPTLNIFDKAKIFDALLERIEDDYYYIGQVLDNGRTVERLTVYDNKLIVRASGDFVKNNTENYLVVRY